LGWALGLGARVCSWGQGRRLMTISGSLAGPKHSKEEKKENESEKGEEGKST